MKSKFLIAILLSAATLGFADEMPNATTLPSIVEKAASAKSFTYLRMGVTDSYPVKDANFIPGVGLGYRLNAGNSAFDFSASYTGTVGSNFASETYFYTLPKASYLYYVSPASNNSFYAGAGLAFGGMRTQKETDVENQLDVREFQGLIPSLTAGYEMNRKGTLRSFLQFDVSQAAIAAHQVGNLPGIVGEMAFGLGF